MRMLNHAKTAMLLAFLTGLCMLIGHYALGPGGVFIGLLFGGLGNVIAFFYSDKLAVTAMRGQEVTRNDAPQLVDMVARLADRAGVPMPKVYVCPQQAPNAFATGRSPSKAAVAVTQGMLQNFPMQEIEGVLAHEIAHIRNRDTLISTVAAVMASLISFAAYGLMFFGGRRDSPLGAVGLIAMMILAPLAAGLIQMAISRQREYAADHLGGEIAGDPRKLASALRRLEGLNERIPMKANPAFNQMFIIEPLSGDSVGKLFATHPKTEDRIRRLLAQAQQN